MTVMEQIGLVGKKGTLLLDHFRVPMEIMDVKDGGWSRTLVFVKPVVGDGEAWIDLNRLHLEGE